VLDPFGGAGTTALAAKRAGRDAVYIDLNPEYALMAMARVSEG
jgi:DNA modification methylase